MNIQKNWQSTVKLFDDKYKIVVVIFFISFLILGMFIFADYGMSFDEEVSRKQGIVNYEYVLGHNQDLLTDSEKYHGPAFELFLIFAEKIADYEDLGDIFLLRHLLTFGLFYLSVVFFYFLIKRVFGSWKLGLLGSLFLILSPRIFAHAFYNSKDLAFLAMTIIGIYTLIRFLDKKTYLNGLFHAFACAILIDIRIMGFFVPVLTLIFLTKDLICIKRKAEIIKNLVFYLISLVLFIILFWPILWEGPIHHFLEAFREMREYDKWSGPILYLGENVSKNDLPWHYIPVWIMLTTPILYTISFLGGLFVSIKSTITRSKMLNAKQARNNWIFILWFFLPLLMVIILGSVMYNSWRHMFFIYPAFLLIALGGLFSLHKYLTQRSSRPLYRTINIFLIVVVSLSILGTIISMIKYHPHQNVYFNEIASQNMANIKKNFELDYWGLSYRPALEYILAHDDNDEIIIYVQNVPGKINRHLLPSTDQDRLIYTDKKRTANYFLSNYFGHPHDYPYKKEIYSIMIGNAKIMVVYDLTEEF